MKQFLLLFTILTVLLSVRMNAQVLVGQAQPDEITVGQVSRIVYQYKGETDHSIEIPDIENFRIINGPSRRESVSIINGRKSVTKQLTIDIMALRPGEYTIPPARIGAKNSNIQSNELKITVSESDEANLSLSEKLKEKGYSITAEINQDTTYQGEQIIVTYKILTSIAIERYNIQNEDNYDGCLQANLNLNEPTQVDTIDGTVYKEKVIARRALFPYHTGEFNIKPMLVNLYIRSDKKERRGSFFFRGNLKTVRSYSNELNFYVLPQLHNRLDSLLPTGEFAMSASVPDSSYTTDDIIPLKVRIQGNSDPNLMRPPKISTNFPYSLTAPSEKQIKKSADPDGIKYLKVFTYYIQPQDTGTFMFRLYFPHFRKKGQIDTMYSRPISVPIRKGKYYDTDVSINTENSTSEDDNQLPLILGVAAIAVGAIIYGIYYYLRKQKKTKSDADETRNKKGINAVKSTLANAENALQSDQLQESIRHQNKALRQTAQVIQGKDYRLQYSTEELYQNLKNHISVSEANEWLKHIEKLEKMHYGGTVNSAELREVMEKVRDWVKDKFSYFKDNS